MQHKQGLTLGKSQNSDFFIFDFKELYRHFQFLHCVFDVDHDALKVMFSSHSSGVHSPP
jgi:hypothetical protein